jgi:hypothetical protein
MKTAISLPDPLFEAAERTATRLKLSRSELYARALEAYLRQDGAAAITSAVDRVLRGKPRRLDPVLARLQVASVGRDEGPLEEWVDLPRSSPAPRGRRG